MPSPAPHTGAGDRPRPAVLVLVRETTADVTAIDEALHARGARPIIRRPEALTIRINGRRPVILDADGSPLTPDACLGWTSLAARDAGLWLLRALEMAGIPVMNRAAVLDAGQLKPTLSLRLAAAGLPHARTLIAGADADPDALIAELGLPMVVKPCLGTKGGGVGPLDDRAALAGRLAAAGAERLPLYLQEFLPNDGSDLRIQCVDHRPVYAFRRHAAPGAFVANLHAGGRAETLTSIPPALARLAAAAARAVDAPLAGVDLIEVPGRGPVILEVNMTPGIYTAATLAGPDRPVLEPLARQAVDLLAQSLIRLAGGNIRRRQAA
ncbi:ATP-grasp domain-containing protein [Tistrella mobilis]